MLRVVYLAFLLSCALPAGKAFADGQEIGPSQLRKLVSSGRSVSVETVFKTIRETLGGDPIDARAFDIDGIFYCVMVMMPDGKLISVIVDASSGELIPSDSGRAKAVRELAQTIPKDTSRSPHRGQGHHHGHGHPHSHSTKHNTDS